MVVSGQGSTLPVGECKFCGSRVAVRRNGTLRRHGYSNQNPFNVDPEDSACEGSFKKGWALDANGNKYSKQRAN